MNRFMQGARCVLLIAVLASGLVAQFSNIDILVGNSGHILLNDEATIYVNGGTDHAGEFFWIYPTQNVDVFTYGGYQTPTTPGDPLYNAFAAAGWNVNCGSSTAPSWCLTGLFDANGFGTGNIRLPLSWGEGTLYFTAVTFDAALNVTGISIAASLTTWLQYPGGKTPIPGDAIFSSGGTIGPNGPIPQFPGQNLGCVGANPPPDPINPYASFFMCNVAGAKIMKPSIGPTMSFGCTEDPDEAWVITRQELKRACMAAASAGSPIPGTWVDIVICPPNGDVGKAFINPSWVLQSFDFPYWVLDKLDCHPAQLCGCTETEEVFFSSPPAYYTPGFTNDACDPNATALGVAEARHSVCLVDVDCDDSCSIPGFVIRVDCCLLDAILTTMDNIFFANPPPPSTPLFYVTVEYCQ